MAGKISADLLRQIKDRVNIVDVVGEHVVLKKSGSNYSGLCPFHSERSPSFSVTEAKQLYHCFGCKAGGDLISFVSEIHGMSFNEAVEDLAERAGIQIQKQDSAALTGSSEMAKRAQTAFKLNRFAAAFFRHHLAQDKLAQSYLSDRSITLDQQKHFYLGSSPADWDQLTRKLIESKAPVSLAQNLGLIRPSTKNAAPGSPGYFDLFRGRVIFPILNRRGKVAGFGGRLIKVPPDKSSPKYLNSGESFIFQKNKLLYGLYQAQKFIREHDQVIVVEGYFDVLALRRAGFKNVVATCGTALTTEHVAILKRFCQQIVLLFDGDEAGQNATEKAMQMGLAQGSVLYGVELPGGKDPDEFLSDPGASEIMKDFLSQPVAILDDLIERQIQSAASGPEAKSQAIKQIAEWLKGFKDPVGQIVRIEQVANKLGVSAGQALQSILKVPGSPQAIQHRPPQPNWNSPQRQRPAVRQAAPQAGAEQGLQQVTASDRLLIQLVVHHEEFSDLIASVSGKLSPELDLSDLAQHGLVKNWVGQAVPISQESQSNSDKKGQKMLEICADPVLKQAVVEALVSDSADVSREDLKQMISAGTRRAWARFSHAIKLELMKAARENRVDQLADLKKEYLDVQRKKEEVNSFYEQE